MGMPVARSISPLDIDAILSPLNDHLEVTARRAATRTVEHDAALIFNDIPFQPSMASDRQREEAFRIQEPNHTNGLEDPREDHEAEFNVVKEAHAEAIDAASALESSAERKVEELTLEEIGLEKELQAQETVSQKTIADSQELQDNREKLKDKHDASLNNHSRIGNMFQQENAQLLGVILPMQIKEQEQSPRCSSTEQIEATSSEFEEQQEMRNQLQKVQRENSTLSAGLAAAQHQALYFQERAQDLTHALLSSPNEFANVRGVLEQKDRIFSDLEKKAGEYFDALVELKKSSEEEKELAWKETAMLKDKLHKSQLSNAAHQVSKDTFQSHCEDVYTMLQKKVFATDFTEAICRYFEIVTHDNTILKNEVQRQGSEISRDDSKISSLENEIRIVKKALQEKEKSGSELETTVRSKEIDIGRLEMRLGNITCAFKESGDEKDAQIADLADALQDRFNMTLGLIEKSREDAEREFLGGREDEIRRLGEKCQQLTDINNQLEWRLELEAKNCADNAKHACLKEQAAEEYKHKWEEVENETKRIREQLGIPDSAKVPSVLDQKLELDEKRLEIEVLGEEVMAAQDEAAKFSTAYDKGQKFSEQWAKQLWETGYELLGRLRNTEGPFRFNESDIPTDVLAQILDECRNSFEPKEVKGKGKEREH